MSDGFCTAPDQIEIGHPPRPEDAQGLDRPFRRDVDVPRVIAGCGRNKEQPLLKNPGDEFFIDVLEDLADALLHAVEFPRHQREPVEQGLAARDDDPGMAAEHLRLAARQMKLASADIDPHIGVGHHQIGVAGKA